MAIGPDALEGFAPVFHLLDGLRPDPAAAFRVIRLEVEDLEVAAVPDGLLDEPFLFYVGLAFVRPVVLKAG